MHDNIVISIVIATFNSERTLQYVFDSIARQSFPRKQIEVIVVDGGSTDTTLALAKKFQCRIIKNTKVEPLYAKYLGYLKSTGDYLMYIDHDEELENNNSLQRRVEIFTKHKDVKGIVASGYISPPGFNIVNQYINEFGDAFSFFIYRLSKKHGIFTDIMKKRYQVLTETPEYIIVDISSGEAPLIELAAGGGMIDAVFFKKNYPFIIEDYTRIPHFLHLLRSENPNIVIMKDDGIIHYSSDNLKSYITKVQWRIKNNIFYTQTIGASGFNGRLDYHSPASVYKKYLFIPYVCFFIFPVFDALILSIQRRNIAYLIHIPLSVITAYFIIYYYMLKLFGIKPDLLSYDGTKKAYEK